MTTGSHGAPDWAIAPPAGSPAGDTSIVNEFERQLDVLFSGFNRKDVADAARALHPDVDWPDLFGGARLRGPEAVQAMWARQFGQFDTKVSPIALTPDGDDGVRARVNYVVRGLDGRLFNEETATHLFRFRDGLIIRMTMV